MAVLTMTVLTMTNQVLADLTRGEALALRVRVGRPGVGAVIRR